MEKKIVVYIVPGCISCNRELQYIEQAKALYNSGDIPGNMTVEETAERVIITYYR